MKGNKLARVGHVEKEMKRLIIEKVNAANWYKRKIKLGITECEI